MVDAASGQIDLVMVIARAVVLVIAALGGVLSIYLGWKLYRDGLVSAVDSELSKNESFKIKLSSAGPGVFFALFGMWLLVHLVEKQVVMEDGPVQSTSAALYNTADKPFKIERAVFATKKSAGAKTAKDAPEVCFVRAKKRVFFLGNELTGDRIKADLDTALLHLKNVDQSKLSDNEATAVIDAVATLEHVRESTGEWTFDQ